MLGLNFGVSSVGNLKCLQDFEEGNQMNWSGEMNPPWLTSEPSVNLSALPVF